MKGAVLAFFLFLAGCSQGPDVAGAGGSSETTNSLTACVRNSDGTAAAGAAVRMRRAGYFSSQPSLGKTGTIIGADASTDSNGRFSISGTAPGAYAIEVNNEKSAAVLMACTLAAQETLDLGVATLRPYAAAIGMADTTLRSAAPLFVQVGGLERLVAVAADGRYSLTSLPEGIFSLRIGSIDAPTIISGVQAVSADTAVAPSSLPAPWKAVAVGNETPRGGAMFTNGQFTVAGGGPDIWGTADGFHFVYCRAAGDIEITVRVLRSENTSIFSKAAIMIRESLDPGARHATYSLNRADSLETAAQPNSTVLFGRLVAGDTTLPPTPFCDTSVTDSVPDVDRSHLPVFLRLVRTGDLIRTFVSADGVVWKNDLMRRSMPLPDSVYVGLAVSSRTTAKINMAVFDSLRIGQP